MERSLLMISVPTCRTAISGHRFGLHIRIDLPNMSSSSPVQTGTFAGSNALSACSFT